MYMGRTVWFSAMLLSKWPPGSHIGFFGFQTLTLVWFWIWTRNFNGPILVYMSSPEPGIDFQWPHFLNGCLVAMLDFLVSGLCRWHGLGSVTHVCFGISVSNFMCMSFVAVGKSLMIFSYIAFKTAALWFWAMVNCNSPFASCYPLLWGGVYHWSTISS